MGRLQAKQQLSPEDLLLLDAADYLESDDNWVQGKLFLLRSSTVPRACAIGALGAVMPGPNMPKPSLVGEDSSLVGAGALGGKYPSIANKAISQLDRYLCYATSGKYIDVVPWNDTPGRTKQEVVTAMREAATLVIPTNKK